LYLAGVRELVSHVAKRLGFGDEAAGQMALAVDEALCNVIRHGYSKQPDRPIWLSMWPEGGAWQDPACASNCCCAGQALPDALRIVIEDEAKQVDPSTIRSRDLEEIRPGGLGVHIIQSVMDEARYERRDGAGMRLVMVKKRPAAVVAQTPPGHAVAGAARA
jgi:serine/threonine-protein kinase RsbW